MMLVLPFVKIRHADRYISGILAILWLWIGVVFMIIYYRALNGITAVIFGVLLAIQGVLFFYHGVILNRLHFSGGFEPAKLLGTCLIVYALLVYPFLGQISGHSYPHAPLFGVAPCPTTIFTFGILLWCSPKVPGYLLVIPLLWSLIGVSAALALGIYEDAMMPVAGILGTYVIMRGRHMGPHLPPAPRMQST
jgi:hypothetical protein